MEDGDGDKRTLLHKIYYTEGRLQGRDSLFHYISKTLNIKGITRRYIAEWLSNQRVDQLFQAKKKHTSIRPILSGKPGAIIQIDLIDFSKSPSRFGYNYILNAVDVFSRKCWLKAIKAKSLDSVIPALNNIIAEIQKEHPIKVLQSDNGNEFKFHINGIKHLYSNSYTPQNNAVVERANGTIKRILFKQLYQENEKDWSRYLLQIQDIYNTTLNRNIKGTPNELWSKNEEEQVIEAEKQRNIKSKAFKNLNVESQIKVGSIVRLAEPDIITKKGLPNYSINIFKVSKVIPGNITKSTLPRYKLVDSEGKLLRNTFAYSKLLLIKNVSGSADTNKRPARQIEVVREKKAKISIEIPV